MLKSGVYHGARVHNGLNHKPTPNTYSEKDAKMISRRNSMAVVLHDRNSALILL